MARVADQALPGRTLAVPILGGSLPMHEFDAALHVPLIILAVVNYDNNQHSSDENLRLGHLWDGIGIYAMAMARLGAEWSAASAAEARP
jgi:acetylornithine deacetylase/succinyl-diaminopimelate desuccinylase-like protein